ncbi:XLF-domain-containing protein [Lentithecium fluviatile CBS 122367]|uniref:Non-homologous end-joining factor 1 n=1 Tax=Lentithecium fluviatile CBS 122367 TaxID=1168545 RepID=A0A6G1ICN8_9PLEO|nr:XLF-domain-containing protein [Lentithecium fluviatile CBS 122367]
MSCWRVLELSPQPDSEHIPQLLIKAHFGADAYSVFVTDLSNIWSEELDLSGIVDRASEVESPIEVSKQDTAQLAILLENVRNSLVSSDETSCHMTLASADGITLHTTISLPEPLDSLRWEFHLGKRTAVTLRNELILPLLVSSHIQQDRLNALVSTVSEKDRAITRLVDQYESSNLDLAAAFPSIGSLKSGRRVVKREQAARHVPGLQPFDQDSWKRDTAELHDTDVSALGLFQEVLSECTSKVPPRLLSEDGDRVWWTTIDTTLMVPKPASKSKVQTKPKPDAKPTRMESETEDEETEDEFEVHENFKTRQTTEQTTLTSKPTSKYTTKVQDVADAGTTDEDGDDDDLDALPKSQSQARAHRRPLPRAESSTPEASSPPKERTSSPQVASPPPKGKPSPIQKPKARGFRIGGKSTKSESLAPSTEELEQIPSTDKIEDAASIPSRPKADAEAPTETKTTRKGFRIGGKGKAPVDKNEPGPATSSVSEGRDTAVAAKSPSAQPSTTAPSRAKKEATPAAEEREETAEEKAERKRRELKRKNEEAVKKQVQSKKKKRF